MAEALDTGNHTGDYTEVANLPTVTEAHLIQGALRAAGLDAHVPDANLSQTHSLMTVALGGVRVVVPAGQVAAAREILQALDRGELQLDGDEPFTTSFPDPTDHMTSTQATASNMVFCRECGKDLHHTAPICPNCGAVQPGGKGLKNKTSAALLAILLGGIGVHRFYLGQWWGLFYLLLCWTGIPGVIAFIEGIVFLCTDLRKWDAKYNNGIPSGQSGLGAVAIAVVVLIVGIAIIGVLAAIAIPTYQDYVVKARVNEALVAIGKATPQVGAYIETQRAVPQSLQQAGFEQALPASIGNVAINQRTGEIQVTLTGKPSLDGATFSMVPTMDDSNHVTWRCVSTMRPNQLPQACRP